MDAVFLFSYFLASRIWSSPRINTIPIAAEMTGQSRLVEILAARHHGGFRDRALLCRRSFEAAYKRLEFCVE